MTGELELFRRLPLAPGDPQIGSLLATRLRKKTADTRRSYGYDLDAFARYVGMGGRTDEALQRLVHLPREVADELVERYVATMVDGGLAPATVNRRLAALRAVVKIARRATLCDWSLEVEGIPAEAFRDTRGPGIAAIRQILAHAKRDESPKGRRDACIVRWLYALAIRRTELVRLDLADVEWSADDGWRIQVRRKYKRMRRAEPLEESCHEALQAWLHHRGDAPGPLFSSLHRGRIDRPHRLHPCSINKILRERVEGAGFPNGRLPDGRSITPHGFRHTALSRTAKYHGLQAAQELGRHRSPTTTQVYLDNLGESVRSSQSTLAGELDVPDEPA